MTPVELRELFADESLVLKLTSSSPPLVSQVSEHTRPNGSVYYEILFEEEPADRIGQSLSGTMVSLIGGVTEALVSYSPRWPVRRAMEEWERQCRRRHQPSDVRWRDHLDGPLCSDLLRASSVGVSLAWCCNAWEVDYPRGERLLTAGLRFVSERLARWQDEQLGILHDRQACDICQEQDAVE